jgi:hypothetical protein
MICFNYQEHVAADALDVEKGSREASRLFGLDEIRHRARKLFCLS